MNEMNETINTVTDTENTAINNTTINNDPANTAQAEDTGKVCCSEKCESRYYTLKAVQETRESIKKRLDVYNEKYVKKTVETGRTFVKELNNDPLKKIDELIDNGTKAAKNLKEDSRKKYDELKEKTRELKGRTKEFTERLKTSPLKAMGDAVREARADATRKIDEYIGEYRENSRKLIENIEKDAEMAKQEIIDAGKKAIDKIAVRKMIEEKLTNTVEKFPSMLNLPSKKEVEDLIKGVDSVNRKVDSLAIQQSAA